MPPSLAARKPSAVARFPDDRLGDAELVEAVVRGDTAAVGVVWDRYSGLVRSVLRANLGADPALEDLLQEVFVAFLDGARRLREGGALRAYLVTVAVRLVLVELRRRKVRRWVSLSATGDLPDVPSGPRDVEGLEALRALHRLLTDLPSRGQVAFVLRHVHGFEIAEVASTMGVSESTAKRAVSKARDLLLARARSREPLLWQYLTTIPGATDV